MPMPRNSRRVLGGSPSWRRSPAGQWRDQLDRYVRLVAYKTYAELKAESERTYIGFVWWVAEPILSMGVYYLVFETILDRGTDDYAVFLFVGLVPWRWLQSTVTHGASAILGERSLMQQVFLPKVLLTLTSVLADTFKFLVVFALLLAALPAFGYPPTAAWTALPLIVFVQLLFVAALSTVVAAVTPFLPDLRIVLENVIRLWFFLSGVFYSVESVAPQLQEYLGLNPMTLILQAYRDVLLAAELPATGKLFAVGGISMLGLALGFALTRRFDYAYPKLRF